MAGLGKYFNRKTINGRSNVAKATYGTVALMYIYYRMKKGNKQLKGENLVEEQSHSGPNMLQNVNRHTQPDQQKPSFHGAANVRVSPDSQELSDRHAYSYPHLVKHTMTDSTPNKRPANISMANNDFNEISTKNLKETSLQMKDHSKSGTAKSMIATVEKQANSSGNSPSIKSSCADGTNKPLEGPTVETDKDLTFGKKYKVANNISVSNQNSVSDNISVIANHKGKDSGTTEMKEFISNNLIPMNSSATCPVTKNQLSEDTDTIIKPNITNNAAISSDFYKSKPNDMNIQASTTSSNTFIMQRPQSSIRDPVHELPMNHDITNISNGNNDNIAVNNNTQNNRGANKSVSDNFKNKEHTAVKANSKNNISTLDKSKSTVMEKTPMPVNYTLQRDLNSITDSFNEPAPLVENCYKRRRDQDFIKDISLRDTAGHTFMLQNLTRPDFNTKNETGLSNTAATPPAPIANSTHKPQNASINSINKLYSGERHIAKIVQKPDNKNLTGNVSMLANTTLRDSTSGSEIISSKNTTTIIL